MKVFALPHFDRDGLYASVRNAEGVRFGKSYCVFTFVGVVLSMLRVATSNEGADHGSRICIFLLSAFLRVAYVEVVERLLFDRKLNSGKSRGTNLCLLSLLI